MKKKTPNSETAAERKLRRGFFIAHVFVEENLRFCYSPVDIMEEASKLCFHGPKESDFFSQGLQCSGSACIFLIALSLSSV